MKPEFVPVESQFHCSAEWHLRQMKSRFAPLLYSWARRLSKKSRVFSASAENVSAYFYVDRKTVLSALDELAVSGFFEITHSERFKPSLYLVVDHRDWAKRHPDRCLERVSFPWEGEGDSLGRQLYAISGGRVKFWPRHMTGLRNLGFSDEQIIEQFRGFMEAAEHVGLRWNRAFFDFHAGLKAISSGTASSRTDTVRVQSNGHGRVQSIPPAESNRLDPSLRSSSPKGVDEQKLTIPGSPNRPISNPSLLKPLKDKSKSKEASHAAN